MRLLILGASARAAAASAVRAGLEPIGIDLFADTDLAAIAPSVRIPADSYPLGLEALAADWPTSPWIYTGAVENHPALVDRIAEARPLWGVAGPALRAARDPIGLAGLLRVAGLPGLEVRLEPPDDSDRRPWLVKPIASAGGRGVRPYNGQAGRPGAFYYQRWISGRTLAAVAVAEGPGTRLLGITGHWIDEGAGPADFVYRGSIGPWPVAANVQERVEVLCRTLAQGLGLTGLFGVDFIENHGVPWLLEVNPRYTASMEVLELALGRSMLDEHRRACDPDAWTRAVITGSREARPAVVGKRLIIADGPCCFPEIPPRRPTADPFALPRIADVPAAGTRFEAGQPVLTLIESGPSIAACRACLERRRRRWEARLSGSGYSALSSGPA
jgi:predicted ATP-grasp superfamily ATP-dependent carboligase